MNIVQQLAAIGLVIMGGIWARQKYQERKKGVKGQSCSTCKAGLVKRNESGRYFNIAAGLYVIIPIIP